jgi:hypothetical protein
MAMESSGAYHGHQTGKEVRPTQLTLDEDEDDLKAAP